jgi:hypothetical protein
MEGGEIRVMDRSAGKYKDIGTILLKTDDVTTFEMKAQGDPNKAIRMVYEEWIRGDEHSSWKKLTKCFRKVNLNTLAGEIEKCFTPDVQEEQNGVDQQEQSSAASTDTLSQSTSPTNSSSMFSSLTESTVPLKGITPVPTPCGQPVDDVEDLNEQLIDATRNGDVEKVRRVLHNGATIKTRTKSSEVSMFQNTVFTDSRTHC